MKDLYLWGQPLKSKFSVCTLLSFEPCDETYKKGESVLIPPYIFIFCSYTNFYFMIHTQKCIVIEAQHQS